MNNEACSRFEPDYREVLGRKMRVGFSMIHYPVAMGRYILDALLQREDVEVWSVGPFTDTWIPWGGGMVLPQSYVLRPDLPFPHHAHSIIDYNFVKVHQPHEFDLWIEVNSDLKTTGRPDCPYSIVGTDPHVLSPLYDAVRPRADKFFCMQKNYMRPGDIWLPYAHDPLRYHQPTTIPWKDREYDITLIGLQYPKRQRFFKQMQAEGFSARSEIGIAYDDVKAIYHNTRIGFNWASLQDTCARVFEVMGFGLVPLLSRVPDQAELFEEGAHFYGFDTHEEAIEKAKWILAHPAEAHIVAQAAHEEVQKHTWERRASQILFDSLGETL